jgi:CheY-like chemotaxis protein
MMETILLVDDNPLRAAMRKSILDGSASSVVRVGDASAALCAVEAPEFAESLVLIIVAHSLSGISGPELAAELRTRIPHVPILILSPLAGNEAAYDEISGLFHSTTKSPDELRSLVSQLVSGNQKRSA